MSTTLPLPVNSMAAARPIPPLSPRERETLAALLSGLQHKQIARRLGLSSHTVHGYVKSVYERYQVGSQTELMALFIPWDGS